MNFIQPAARPVRSHSPRFTARPRRTGPRNGVGFRALLLGFLALVSASPAAGQIPEGYELFRLTDDGHTNLFQVINNRGQVAWAKRAIPQPGWRHIMLWDNGRLRQVSPAGLLASAPEINDAGTIVFVAGTVQDDPTTYHVARWADGVTTWVTDTDGPNTQPAIDASGRVVWERWLYYGCAGVSKHLYMHNRGATSLLLMDDPLLPQAPVGAGDGFFTWQRGNFCVSPWHAYVDLLSDGAITTIAGPRQVGITLPNRWGDVGWTDGTSIALRGAMLYRHDTGQVARIGFEGDVAPNAQGQIALRGKPTETDPLDIWLWHGGQWLRVLGAPGGSARINDTGEIAMAYRTGPTAVHIDVSVLRRMTIPADISHDFDVDLDDFAILQQCWPAEGQAMALHCAVADVNRDGAINLADYDMLRERMHGPRAAGDVDYDGDVDLQDLTRLMECQSRRDRALPLDCWGCDFGQDGWVDLQDYEALLKGWTGPRAP